MSAAAQLPTSRHAARRDAVILLYQHDVTGLEIDDLFENARRGGEGSPDPFTRELVDAVLALRDEIDARIGEAAEGWTVERIAPLERSILRVAVHEMLHREDIPVAVAINEAVELAKRFCQAEAPGFVNGILGAVAEAQQGAA